MPSEPDTDPRKASSLRRATTPQPSAAGWRLALLLVVTAVFPATAKAVGQPVPVRVEHYRIAVDLRPESQELSATTTLRLRGVAETVPSLPFEIENTLKIDSVQDSEGRSLAAVHVGPSYSHSYLLELAQPLRAGEALEVVFRYHGSMVEKPLDYIAPYGVLLRDESRWYPIVDLSSIAGLEMRVTVPAGWETVTSGDLVEQVTSGDRTTFFWRTERPVSSRSLAAGPLHVAARELDGLAVYVYLASEDPALASSLAERLSDVVRFYRERFGVYPWKRFSVVEGLPRPPGETGYSAPGFLVASRRALRNHSYLDYNPQFLPHEVAHQWFPGEVTMASESDAFIAESLAEYCALLYLKRILPARASLDFIRASHLAALGGELLPLEPGLRLFRWYDWPTAYRTLYQRGMLVYSTLEALLGEEAMLQLLREFYARYRGRVASVASLQSLAEEIHGVPLGWFFDLYLKGTKLPEITLTWDRATGGARGHLQVADVPPDFLLPVELETGVARSGASTGSRTIRALVFARGGDNTFTLEGSPAVERVVIDPDWKILFWREETKRSRALARLLERAAEDRAKGKLLAARKTLREALAADPDNRARQHLWVRLALGRVLFQERQYRASLAELSHARAAGSFDPAATSLVHTWARIFRGYALERLGRRSEAILEYRQALRESQPPILDTPFDLEELGRVATAGEEIAARLARPLPARPKKR